MTKIKIDRAATMQRLLTLSEERAQLREEMEREPRCSREHDSLFLRIMNLREEEAMLATALQGSFSPRS